MNGVNLNENEKVVLAEFSRHGEGIWLSRQYLENDLCTACELEQRTLDRILQRLVKWNYIVKVPTKDRGALYALSSDKAEELEEFARECDTRGAMVSVESPPLMRCPHCSRWIKVLIAREFGELKIVTDEDAQKLLRKRDQDIDHSDDTSP